MMMLPSLGSFIVWLRLRQTGRQCSTGRPGSRDRRFPDVSASLAFVFAGEPAVVHHRVDDLPSFLDAAVPQFLAEIVSRIASMFSLLSGQSWSFSQCRRSSSVQRISAIVSLPCPALL